MNTVCASFARPAVMECTQGGEFVPFPVMGMYGWWLVGVGMVMLKLELAF